MLMPYARPIWIEGISIEIPGREYYLGYSAYLRDPDGRLIELTQEGKAE